MPVVSRHDIDALLGPLFGLTSEQETEVAQMDPNDGQEMRAAIRKYCGCNVANMRQEVKERYKNALRYFLTTRQADFQAIVDGMQDFALGSPDDPRDLFLWTWQALFPEEDYRIQDLSGWVVDDEPRKMPPSKWWQFWK